jgi:hypothetical protein
LFPTVNLLKVDSTGLGSVARSLKQIDGAGNLILCGVDERVLSLLKMTRLDEIFIQKANRKTALSHFFWERKQRPHHSPPTRNLSYFQTRTVRKKSRKYIHRKKIKQCCGK